MSDASRCSFGASDLEGLWADHPYYEEQWTQPPPAEETITEVEKRLGYRLPAAYIELCHHRNGGGLQRDCFPTMEATSWAEDHVAITAYSAIGWDTANSLCGSCGSQFMIEEWGYPPIGIVFGQCPSAGHDVIMLDYSECGPEGEPRVIHVDQEFDYARTLLAPDFASFIKGLVPGEDFEDVEEEERERLHAVESALSGSLSPQILRLLEASDKAFPGGELFLRKQLAKIAQEKGGLLLHGDPASFRVYSFLYWLLTFERHPGSWQDALELADGQSDYSRSCIALMLFTSFVKDPYEVCTGGFAPGFFADWWNDGVDRAWLVSDGTGGYVLSEDRQRQLLAQWSAIAQEST